MVRSYLNNLLTKGCSAFLCLYLILLPCYDAIFIWKGHKWQIKRFVKSTESTLQLRTEITFSAAINWMNKNLNIFFSHFYGKLELVKGRKVAKLTVFCDAETVWHGCANCSLMKPSERYLKIEAEIPEENFTLWFWRVKWICFNYSSHLNEVNEKVTT